MDDRPGGQAASVTRGRDPAMSRLSPAQRHGGGRSRRGAGGAALHHQRKVKRAGFPRKRKRAFLWERLDPASLWGKLNRGVLPVFDGPQFVGFRMSAVRIRPAAQAAVAQGQSSLRKELIPRQSLPIGFSAGRRTWVIYSKIEATPRSPTCPQFRKTTVPGVGGTDQ
jgi:hypothetical protein